VSTPYLTVEEFTLRTTMPSAYVTALENRQPGWLAMQLESSSRADLDGPLRKRYSAPFDEPVPEIVKIWLARLVTPEAWSRYGYEANEADMESALKAADRTREAIKQAADAQNGLYDLPLRDDAKGTGISKGTPRVYSEQSPYVWTDRQRATGREEDNSRGGSYG
jgi:hypothetical protein